MGQNQLYEPSFLDTVSHRTKYQSFHLAEKPTNTQVHSNFAPWTQSSQSWKCTYVVCPEREEMEIRKPAQKTSSNTTMLYLRYILADSILICSPFCSDGHTESQPIKQNYILSRLQRLLWQLPLPIGIKTISHMALHRSLRCSHPFPVLPMSLCPCLHIH